jgi:hypothetical protein
VHLRGLKRRTERWADEWPLDDIERWKNCVDNVMRKKILLCAALLAFFTASFPLRAQPQLDQRQLQLKIQELKLQQSQQQLMQEQRFQQQQLQPGSPPLQQQQFRLEQSQQRQVEDQQLESLRLQVQQQNQIDGASTSALPALPAAP